MTPRTSLIAVAIGRVAQVGYVWSLSRLATHTLGPEGMGRMNLVLSVYACAIFLLVSPVANFFNRHALEWQMDGTLRKNFNRYTAFLGAVAAATAVALLIVQSTIGTGIEINTIWLLCLVTGSVFFNQLNGLCAHLMNIMGHRIWYVTLINLSSWLGIGAALAITRARGASAEYWLCGLLAGQILVLCLALPIVRLNFVRPEQLLTPGNGTQPFEFSSVLAFSSPLIVSTCFYWIHISGYRFALRNMTDEATVGLFTVGIGMAMAPMSILDALFSEYYSPIFLREIAGADKRQIADAFSRYTSAYFPVIVLACACIAVSGTFLARLMVSKEFYTVGNLALWGALLQGAIMLNSSFSNLIFASRDTRVSIIPSVCGAASAIAGVVLLAKWDPLPGSGIALFAAMALTVCVTGRKLRRSFPFQLPFRRLGLSCVLAAPIVAGGIALQFLFPNPTTVQSLGALSTLGAYTAFAQYLMSREWISQPGRKDDAAVVPLAASVSAS